MEGAGGVAVTDKNAAFLPNAIAAVRAQVERTLDVGASLVANRPLCMASYQRGETTPEEIWAVAERFVAATSWSNKAEVIAKLREHFKVRLAGRMVTLEEAQRVLSADMPYGGGWVNQAIGGASWRTRAKR